jgi:hypothetical protein
MTLKLFISLPKKYDKEDAIFERVPCQKNQKAIRINKDKENLRIKKKQKENPNQFFDWATPPAGDELVNVRGCGKQIDALGCVFCGDEIKENGVPQGNFYFCEECEKKIYEDTLGVPFDRRKQDG